MKHLSIIVLSLVCGMVFGGEMLNRNAYGVKGTDSRVYALSFNNTTQCGSAPDNANHEIGTTNFTVSCWVKTTSASNAGLVGKTRAFGEVGRWYLDIDSSMLKFGVAWDVSTAIEVTAGLGILTNGNWHLIAGTVNRTGLQTLYLDGNTVGTPTNVSTYSGVNMNNADVTMIGAYPNSGGVIPTSGYFLNGSLDDIAIWHRALTSNEVADVWNNGTGLAITSSRTFPSTGTGMGLSLASVYSLNEGRGTNANDSVNGVTLVLTNSPTWIQGKLLQ